MRKLFFVVLLALAALTGCGGGSSNSSGSNPINVSVTPNANPVIVGVSLTQQFMASVSGTSNQAVTWSVSGSSCTGATCGTITQSGLYTAPSAPPVMPATVTVTATSQADSKQFRNVTVRIVDILVSVLPNSATVALNGTQQFTATVSPSSPVNWSVSGSGCSGAACGTVSSSGLYTAPSTLPSPPTVTVTATSAVDTNSTPANAIVTLVSSFNSRVKGTYAFRFSGFDSGGAVYSAGIFTADGASPTGHISAGVEDINPSSGVPQNLAFTGTYTVGSDNRGTMTLTAGSVTSTYDFAIGSGGEAIFIEADTTLTRGAGIFDKADATAFSNGKISGPFVMGLFGSDQAGKRVGAAGLFNTDGMSPGHVTVGAIDINDAGTYVPGAALSGTYGVASNGRGTLQVTVPALTATFNFAFYVVSTGELFIVSTDPVSATIPRVGGLVLSQAVNVYSDASFMGNGVFNLTGLNPSSSSVVAVGILGTDGAGNVTSGSMFDENNAGAIVSQQSLAGTYNISAIGVGTISFTSSNAPASSFALYAITTNKAFLVDTSSANALSGIVEPQITGSAGSFSAATIQGAFITGTTSTANTGATNLSGVLSLDGSSIIAGTQDQSTPSMNSAGQSFAATYTVAANGRGTMNVSAPSATTRVLYVINGSKFATIDVDNADANSAVIESER